MTTPPIVQTAPPPVRFAISRISSSSFAAPASASRRLSIGVEPACAAWPRKVTWWRSTPNVPEHDAERQVQRLEHRSLLDVQLEVGGRALELRARLERPVELDAVRAQRVGQRDAVGVVPLPQLVLVGHRAAGGRRAEERAAEARALLVGPVDEPHRHRRLPVLGDPAQHLDPGHDVQAAVEPAAVRHRVDVPADQHRALRGAAQREPLVARLVELVLERQAVRACPRSHSRACSQVSVQATRCAPFSSPVSSCSSRSSATVRRGIERHGATLTRSTECGKHPRMASIAVDRTTTPRIGAVARRTTRAARRRRSRSSGALWEGYRWLGDTLGHGRGRSRSTTRTCRTSTTCWHAFTQPLQPDGPPLDPLPLALGALHRQGGAARLRARRGDRLRARCAALALADRAARPPPVHRRLADGADPRGRADGRRRPRHERRHALGRRSR